MKLNIHHAGSSCNVLLTAEECAWFNSLPTFNLQDRIRVCPCGVMLIIEEDNTIRTHYRNCDKQKKKVYISGKIGDLDWDEVQIKFGKAETILTQAGYEVINPLTVCKDLPGDWGIRMKANIKALMDCDFILLLADWEDSKGAQLEAKIASDIGVLAFTDLASFKGVFAMREMQKLNKITFHRGMAVKDQAGMSFIISKRVLLGDEFHLVSNEGTISEVFTAEELAGYLNENDFEVVE